MVANVDQRALADQGPVEALHKQVSRARSASGRGSTRAEVEASSNGVFQTAGVEYMEDFLMKSIDSMWTCPHIHNPLSFGLDLLPPDRKTLSPQYPFDRRPRELFARS